MIIIGSQALAYYNLKDASKSDLDVICSKLELFAFCGMFNLVPVQLKDYCWQVKEPRYGHIEFEISDVSESASLYEKYVYSYPSLTKNSQLVYDRDGRQWYAIPAPLEVLYSIKRSHRHYPRAWEKHIHDYIMLQDILRTDELEEITKLREKETEIREGKLKTPSLNKKTSEFFDDNVSNKTFVHDEIHSIMAHREKPMYEYIKVSPDKVTCSKQKFFELSFKDQVKCVLEETYVIALERAIIPMLYEQKQFATAESAIKWALMRICTTLTSGWFREFATDHYIAIFNSYDKLYVQKFLQAVDDGRIIRIQ